MVWSGIHASNNSGGQSISHLEIPTMYQYLTGTTILIPMGTKVLNPL